MDGISSMFNSMLKSVGLKPDVIEAISNGLLHDLKKLMQQNEAIINNQRSIMAALNVADQHDNGNRGDGSTVVGSYRLPGS